MKRADRLQNNTSNLPLRSWRSWRFQTYGLGEKFLGIILFALLLAACHDPFVLSTTEQTPIGMGAVKLNFAGTNARTILPNDDLVIGNFDMIKLEFFSTTNDDFSDFDLDKAKFNDTIYLLPGNYDLLVTGWINDTIMAQDFIEDIDIFADQIKRVDVFLKAIPDAGTGTFSWAVEYPDTATEVKMTKTPFPTGTERVLYLKGAPTGETDLGKNGSINNISSGYYMLVVTLTNNDTRTAGRREILHVYQNRTSLFEFTFTDAHFNIISAGTATHPFLVNNIDDLRAVGRGGTDTDMGNYTTGKYVNWTLDKHYRQTVPITHSGSWLPIPGVFIGSYDGNNNTITGLTINISGNGAGMFRNLGGNSEVKNLGLLGVNITGTGNNFGGLAGDAGGGLVAAIINNCFVTGTIEVTGQYIGGLVGAASRINVTNSYFNGTVESKVAGDIGGINTGGLVGNITNLSFIVDSYVSGSVVGRSNLGGLVGNAGAINTDISITNSYCTATVFGTGNVIGGIVGRIANGGKVTITNSYVTGNVTGTSSVGGLVGGVVVTSPPPLDSKITKSYVSGIVKGYNNVGGLVGEAVIFTIQDSYSTGNVIGDSNNVGGIIGYTIPDTINNILIERCFSTGNISAGTGTVNGRTAGGIVGYNTAGTIRNCVALGEVITRNGSAVFTEFGRIAGLSIGGLSNNRARSDMKFVNVTPVPAVESNASGIHGLSIDKWDTALFNTWGFTDPWWTGRFPEHEVAQIGGGINIVFNMSNLAPELEDLYPGLTGITLSRLADTQITLTVDNPDDFTSIQWWYQNTLLNDSATANKQAELTLSASNSIYNNPGSKSITLEVITNATPAVPYSRLLRFTVVE